METGLSNRATKTIQRAIAAATAAGALLIAGTAQAALQDRDLDGDTVVDAFYDTDLDITWLRNADVNGLMDWDTAVSWANAFSFAGYGDWRLPNADPACVAPNYCPDSEMGHLWYVELGNPMGGPMTNAGSFQNLQSYYYLSGTEYAPDVAWIFRTFDGYQDVNYKAGQFYAMAVRPGDVIPEPQTVVLLLAGLTVVALATRRRRVP